MSAREGAERSRRRSIRRGKGPGRGAGTRCRDGSGRRDGRARGSGKDRELGGVSGSSIGEAGGLRAAGRRLMVATLVALADDVRDRDGVVRPALRRAADRLAAIHLRPVNRLGAASLRADPPALLAGIDDATEGVATAGEAGEALEADVVELVEDEPRSGA